MGRTHPKVLLVEGDEDKRVIPHLIEANGIRWGERDEPKVVEIYAYDGVENLLRPGEIETWLKGSGLKALGILVDADESAPGRWRRIRERCAGAFHELPEHVPASGLVATNERGIRLGVWLMPDNTNRGMLETFLSLLRPDTNEPLWEHARAAHAQARVLGAPCTQAHEHKAQIHTWLAWQDPPGRQLHQAVIERMLDPKAPHAALFLNWFKKLYDL